MDTLVESAKVRLSFTRLNSLLTIVMLVILMLTHGILYWVTSNTAKAANAQSALISARSSASNLGNLMELLNQSLAAQAADLRLATILTQADPGKLREEEARLTQAVAGALLVRLLPGNIEAPDETRSPKMGFSDLHMVISAVNGNILPSINLANSPDVHLAVAMRLTSGGGVLHASWPVKLIKGALAFDGACGVALRQENLDLVYQGKASCKENNEKPDGEIEVKGTAWKIGYWRLPEESLDLEWFVGSLVASLVIVGGLSIFLIRLLNSAISHDRKKLVKMAQDVVNSHKVGEISFKLNDFEKIASDISRLKRAKREAKPHSSDQRPQPTTKPEQPLEPAGEPLIPMDVSSNQELPQDISPAIFRADGIGGTLGEKINTNVVYALGLAIGTEMSNAGEIAIVAGHDGRLSSSDLYKSLCKGLMDSGRTVIDIGLIPTPLMYFATHTLNAPSGVIVTGSHHPANYSGLKIIIGGKPLFGPELKNLRTLIMDGNLIYGQGQISSYNLLPEYKERIVGDTQLGHPLKVVVDCGNGSASVVAPNLIRSLGGCEVISLFCEVDGHFPNHAPDPGKPENLQALIDMVLQTKADLGVAYDGDGDRLGLVDSSGKIIWPDRQMMLFAADVLSREPGADIIFDIRCTRNLPTQIVKLGGRPIIGKSGHATMKTRLKETGAMLAGEMNGHIYFQERWFGFDDAIYASVRMIEILSNSSKTTAEVFAQLPESLNTQELSVLVEDGQNLNILAKLIAFADFSDARITDIDGLRVDFLEGWGLVRASSTISALTFRFEADNEKALAYIQKQFKDLILQIKPDIKLPF